MHVMLPLGAEKSKTNRARKERSDVSDTGISGRTCGWNSGEAARQSLQGNKL